jgi:hypothetical protein
MSTPTDADMAHAYTWAKKIGLPITLTDKQRRGIFAMLERAYLAGIAYGRAHPVPPDRPLSPAEWGEQVFARPDAKAGLASIIGKWPGDETDAEIEAALRGVDAADRPPEGTT